MDSGEFIALDVTEDQLRLMVTEQRRRIKALEHHLTRVAAVHHKTAHSRNKLSFDECNMSTCMNLRRVLEGDGVLAR